MKIKVRLKKYNEQNVEIETEFIRLDALLKFAAIVQTGGEAKMVITDGLVSVDGEVCTQRGKKIYPGQKVVFENVRLNIVRASLNE